MKGYSHFPNHPQTRTYCPSPFVFFYFYSPLLFAVLGPISEGQEELH
jgi:hypothetical protein